MAGLGGGENKRKDWKRRAYKCEGYTHQVPAASWPSNINNLLYLESDSLDAEFTEKSGGT